ncbi:thymidine kinase [Priestia megaterium]|nr:thymidine kinase [Priestia megaterium]
MLEAIVGCIYSDKTTELIALIKEMQRDNKNVVTLKPSHMSLHSQSHFLTHSGIQMKSVSIENIQEIHEHINENTDVLAIDDVHFLEDWDTPRLLNDLVNQGLHVIVSGVDTDFKGEPYGIMSELLAYADLVIKKTAVCSICSERATRSQRLLHGDPVKRSDKLFYIDPHMTYEARCRKHHIVLDD